MIDFAAPAQIDCHMYPSTSKLLPLTDCLAPLHQSHSTTYQPSTTPATTAPTTPAMPSFSTWFSSWSPFHGDSAPTRVSSSSVTEVEKPMHPNQRVEKTWTIAKNCSSNAGDGITDLCIGTPGLTVVTLDPTLLDADLIARVRVTSDKREHLECVSVNSIDKKNDCHVNFKAKSGDKGNLVTEITIAIVEQLSFIATTGGGDLVLHEQVIAPSHSLKGSCSGALSASTPAAVGQQRSLILAATFGSRLYALAPDADVKLHSLRIAAAGTSSIHISARHLAAHTEVAAAMIGAGRVQIATQQFETKEAKLYNIGQDGEMLLSASERFKVEALDGFVRGTSAMHVVVSPGGVVDCASQSLTVKRGGRINVADVQARVAKVELNGRGGGHVEISAPQTELAVESKRGEGVVEYQGHLPPIVRVENQSILVPKATSDRQPVVLGEVVVPSIAGAFESAVPLEKSSEGFWATAVRPFLQF